MSQFRRIAFSTIALREEDLTILALQELVTQALKWRALGRFG